MPEQDHALRANQTYVLLLGVLGIWLLVFTEARADELSDTQKWYETECGDRQATLFPSDESDAVLRSLTAANQRTGEPVYLAWRALVGLCVGAKTAKGDLDLFNSLGRGLDAALDTRVDMELAWRAGDCELAGQKASGLVESGVSSGFDAYAVLDLQVTCGDLDWESRKEVCGQIVVVATEAKKRGHTLAPFEAQVEECSLLENERIAAAKRAEEDRLAKENERIAAAKRAEEDRQARENERIAAAKRAEEDSQARAEAERLERERVAAEERAERERVAAENSERRAEARAQLRELMPQYDEAKAAFAGEQQKGAPGAILMAAGFGAGGALVGLGAAQAVEASAAQVAAMEADTGASYQEEVSRLESANTLLGVGLGAGSTLLTAGVVGVILTASRAKTRSNLSKKYKALKQARAELEGQAQ